MFLNDFQVFRKVGGALEDRVIKWFDYLWQNKVTPALLKILDIKWFDYLWQNKVTQALLKILNIKWFDYLWQNKEYPRITS